MSATFLELPLHIADDIMSSENLLDILAKDNKGNLREVTERYNKFLTDVEQWQALQEAYLAPLVQDASTAIQQKVDKYQKCRSAGGLNMPLPCGPTVPMPLPTDFPLRDESRDTGKPTDGLPTKRNPRGKDEFWTEVYELQLLLPSSYHSAVLQHPSMKQACDFESDFRQLAADRALGDVRATIIKREVVNMKKHQSHSKKTTETMERRINNVNTELDQLADHYRRHWVALLTLGLEESDPIFGRLCDNDLVKFEMGTSQNTLGQSQRPMSWIWGDFGFVESIQDSRYQEFYNDG